MCLNILTRKFWGAQHSPKLSPTIYKPILPVVNVAFTYTNTLPCESTDHCKRAMTALQHKAKHIKFLADMYYNFVIGGDGMVYEARGWWIMPMLPLEFRHNNKDTYYIAYMGQFLDKRPPEHMRRVRHELIEYGISMNLIHKDYTRRDLYTVPRFQYIKSAQ